MSLTSQYTILSVKPRYLHSTGFFCNCSNQQQKQERQQMVEKGNTSDYYNSAFSRRMALAGLKPHHRIALGVSGGPDSMALCVLAASWKTNGLNGCVESAEFVEGLLAITVDHGLRLESKEEANIVSHRVSRMGIRCEIASCDWLEGRPKLGKLQEAAREMRYQILQDVCIKHQIGVLLIAHHADDQAELLILRLSRNSGVLGLAGMALTSEIFASHVHTYDEISKNHGILVVRPLLDFSKEDMYKICQGSSQDWVEDPTNQSQLFARNRIRMSLKNLPSSIFKTETLALSSACRQTRLYVDQVCNNLIDQAVKIMDEGYAVIDLEVLNPSALNDICLSKFVTLVLKFISQRNRQIRGGTQKLLLKYIRTFSCKTSVTAAGCYLCPAPGSKGSKVLICYSVNCPLPTDVQLFHIFPGIQQKYSPSCELEEILLEGKSQMDKLVPDVSEIHFLDTPSDSILTEAKRLSILSDSTYRDIVSLQGKESEIFTGKTNVGYESKHGIGPSIKSPILLKPGFICYFMNRFFVTWNLTQDSSSTLLDKVTPNRGLNERHHQCHCSCGVLSSEEGVQVRNMVESDWLYIAKLSEDPCSAMHNPKNVELPRTDGQKMEMQKTCVDCVKLSAQRAILSLKSIPVAARRSLPVLVSPRGLLISIPIYLLFLPNVLHDKLVDQIYYHLSDPTIRECIVQAESLTIYRSFSDNCHCHQLTNVSFLFSEHWFQALPLPDSVCKV